MKTTFQFGTLILAVSSLLIGCGSSQSNSNEDATASSNVSTLPTSQTTTAFTPLAVAGNDQSALVGSEVTLSGSSNAAMNDSVSYQWVLESRPQNSTALLNTSTTQNVSFVPDSAGDYELSLQVTINQVVSEKDFVKVHASITDADITNHIFTNRSGDCRNYTGQFYASATDIQRNAQFVGDVEIVDDIVYCEFNSNAIPNHDFNDTTAAFATNVSEQRMSFKVPVTPIKASSVTQLSLGTTEAVLLNGVTVDLLAAACYGVGNETLGNEKIGCGPNQNDNPWRYDPMSSLNQFGTDAHHAHVQPSGEYHYHGNPMALFNQTCDSEVSGVIGFAADGYPVFGGCFKDSSGTIRKAVSSYALKNSGGQREAVSGYQTPVAGQGSIKSNNYDGQFRGDWVYQAGVGDLDECNGMTVDGQYGYYVTDQFPWVLNCFKGQIDASFAAPAALNRREHGHTETFGLESEEHEDDHEH